MTLFECLHLNSYLPNCSSPTFQLFSINFQKQHNIKTIVQIQQNYQPYINIWTHERLLWVFQRRMIFQITFLNIKCKFNGKITCEYLLIELLFTKHFIVVGWMVHDRWVVCINHNVLYLQFSCFMVKWWHNVCCSDVVLCEKNELHRRVHLS